MSKLVAFLVAAAGASTVSVGGNFLLKSQVSSKGSGNSDSKESGDSSGTPKTNTQETKLFETLDDFKNAKGGECVSKLFSSEVSFQNLDTSTDTAPTPTTDKDYFGTGSTATSADANGCLIIEWKKDEYGDANKWKGTFTWTWAFKNKDKGFVNFNVAKTSDTQSEMIVKGGFYLLGKSTTGQTDKWEVKYKQEVTTEDKKISNTNFGDKFPKASTSAQPTTTENKDYWGFVKDATSFGEFCSPSSTCTDPIKKTTPKKWTGTLSISSSASSIKGWCEKLDWWEFIFDNTKFKLSSQLEDFKGSWTLQETTVQAAS